MKLLVPLVIALVGLGAGVGAGLALKPPPEEKTACAEPSAAGDHSGAETPAGEHARVPCDPAPDPYAATGHDAEAPKGEISYVAIGKPFVVPIFREEKVRAMVVVSLSVAVGHEAEAAAKAVEPRLRDAFLKVMFRHANTGGFDGSFTTGQKMDDLKSALLKSARETLAGTPVGEVLITEIARQDV